MFTLDIPDSTVISFILSYQTQFLRFSVTTRTAVSSGEGKLKLLFNVSKLPFPGGFNRITCGWISGGIPNCQPQRKSGVLSWDIVEFNNLEWCYMKLLDLPRVTHRVISDRASLMARSSACHSCELRSEAANNIDLSPKNSADIIISNFHLTNQLQKDEGFYTWKCTSVHFVFVPNRLMVNPYSYNPYSGKLCTHFASLYANN